MSEQQQAAAILAAINAALAPKVAYESDKVPSPKRPENYVEVTVLRRFAGEARMGAGRGLAGWRVITRPVSQVSIKDARVMAEATRSALEDVVLTIGGVVTSPIEFESAEPIGPDDGWFSGTTSWTYTH